MNSDQFRPEEFDRCAAQYDELLDRGLRATGEPKEFYARGRAAFLAACLGQLRRRPRCLLDFGCGAGETLPLLGAIGGVERVIGVDISRENLKRARRQRDPCDARFGTPDEIEADGTVDLVYSNGVFHHIPPPARAAAIARIHRWLRPGGLFALWENNPWNPGTRYVMARVPFDRNARPWCASAARRSLRNGGFVCVRTDYLFVFPRALRRLRGLEPWLRKIALGGQYQILAVKS